MMILLFLLVMICILLAWCGQRRASIILFILFLLVTAWVFYHHVTDHLNIQL